MLGIIGAMDVEVNSIKSELENVEIKNIAAMDFYKGTLAGKEVVAVKCGIGKVNAAICAQILVSVFGVSALVNTGVAGSLNNDINICDIVVSTSALEHDMDVTPLGYAKGVIPDMDQSEFKADENLIKLAKDSAEEAGLDVKIFEGKVVSGDQFIGTHEAKVYLRDTFNGDCAEMEGASIAHTAYLNKTPYVVIRAISDKADGGAHMDNTKIIFFDIDGTLIDMEKKCVTEKMLETLRRLQEKGIGVNKVLEYYGIDKSQAMAFGDGNNDIEMFEQVGHPIAMGNASDDLKAISEQICGHVAEDGIYYFCKENNLI